MFTVIFADEFSQWLLSLAADERTSVLAGIELLELYGHNLSRPYADTLKGSQLKNLKELRIQHAGRLFRAFFVFDPLRQAIVLCGGDKTGDKRFYKRMIPLAEHIYNQYLATLDTTEGNQP